MRRKMLNSDKKALTVRFDPELHKKMRRVLFDLETTFQDFAEKKVKELVKEHKPQCLI